MVKDDLSFNARTQQQEYPIKAGFTSNDLFLGVGRSDKPMLLDKTHFFVVLEDEIRDPRNEDELILQDKLTQAYEATELKRHKQRSYLKKKYECHSWQFALGQWLLM